ncbi:hypothetical protein BHM03_00032788 [Ensete ventricosum]|nr:hypothetical protein BHM03_00032788 [Ensete ventricosum]
MEARRGGENHQFVAAGTSKLNRTGKKSLEWDLNDWGWDGDLFVASPLNSIPEDFRNKQLHQDAAKVLVSNCSSSSSEGADFELVDKEKGEAEKRRRIVVGEEDVSIGGAGSPRLKLGAHAYPVVEADLAILEGKTGKKSFPLGGNSSHPACQVEGCDADLSDSKDYHRRHKVCEMHAKASSAVVRNAIQRFCQQCSRFHLLEEFDEGKRSCRRRLAGHNRRRRKTQPDVNVNGNSLIDEQACGYLLISLLRILSNLQCNCCNLFIEYLQHVSLHAANSDQSQDQELLTNFLGNLATFANSFDSSGLSRLLPASQDPQKLVTSSGISTDVVITSVPNGVREQESGNPLCSTAVMTCITGTQDPLRQTDHVTSILDWLSSGPTDIESYIRPGCIVLTIYLRQAESAWVQFEDCGLCNGFFPFIVAEEDVCSEIRILENAINVASCVGQLQERTDAANARNQALDFINELGWLLRRNHMRSASEETKLSQNTFTMRRFRRLMSFAMSREWSAVVKKLLDILFSGTVNADRQSPTELALSENLLHSAVQMNSRPMVELLLRYVPVKASKETDLDHFLFRPDMLGPLGITPLHIAASSNGAESILDALTDDPELVLIISCLFSLYFTFLFGRLSYPLLVSAFQLGIKAWKKIRDCNGFTPEDYALAQGHDSYVRLVQKKIDKQHHLSQVVLNIPGVVSYELVDALKSAKPNLFQITKSCLSRQQPYCHRCSQKLAYPNSVARTMLYRPVMLALVGIAAVCVCMGLLFKTPPQVFYVFPSFRWELLDYGFM